MAPAAVLGTQIHGALGFHIDHLADCKVGIHCTRDPRLNGQVGGVRSGAVSCDKESGMHAPKPGKGDGDRAAGKVQPVLILPLCAAPELQERGFNLLWSSG